MWIHLNITFGYVGVEKFYKRKQNSRWKWGCSSLTCLLSGIVQGSSRDKTYTAVLALEALPCVAYTHPTPKYALKGLQSWVLAAQLKRVWVSSLCRGLPWPIRFPALGKQLALSQFPPQFLLSRIPFTGWQWCLKSSLNCSDWLEPAFPVPGKCRWLKLRL